MNFKSYFTKTHITTVPNLPDYASQDWMVRIGWTFVGEFESYEEGQSEAKVQQEKYLSSLKIEKLL